MEPEPDTAPDDGLPTGTGATSPPRRRRPLLVGAAAALVALAAAVGAALAVDLVRDDDDERAAELELRFGAEDADPLIGEDPTGEALPDTSFTDLDGAELSFADYEGRPLVVNYFASWCAPCVAEMPAFEEVHQELGDEVAFLGINLQDSPAAARDLVARTGVTYDIGRDPDGSLFKDLGAVSMPSTFFVSADGVVVDSHAGALSADELRDLIGELTA